VPICRSRHIAIHALLRMSGVSLKSSPDRLLERLSTVLHGFYALIEQIAPLTDDSAGFLVSLRSRRERAALLLERLSDENRSDMGATLPARSKRPVRAERKRDCNAEPARSDRERIVRLTGWCRWCLLALADLLDALLPAGTLPDGVADRIREVGRKADRLVLAADAPGVALASSYMSERLETWLFDREGLPSLGELQDALANYVSFLAELADAGADKEAIQAIIDQC
jgi:hypothetical protein